MILIWNPDFIVIVVGRFVLQQLQLFETKSSHRSKFHQNRTMVLKQLPVNPTFFLQLRHRFFFFLPPSLWPSSSGLVALDGDAAAMLESLSPTKLDEAPATAMPSTSDSFLCKIISWKLIKNWLLMKEVSLSYVNFFANFGLFGTHYKFWYDVFSFTRIFRVMEKDYMNRTLVSRNFFVGKKPRKKQEFSLAYKLFREINSS